MIKITKASIHKFGKFTDFEINFKDGLNIIYGLNEAGKSTIQDFIKVMLYGFPKRKRVGTLGDRAKFLPWNSNDMSGVLCVEHNNRAIEIDRKFGKTAAGDKIVVRDSITGDEIPKLSVENVGELIFDMPLSMFEKTLFINQGSSYIGGSDEDITTRLVNLAQSHDEEVSTTKALDILKRAKMKIKANDKRNNSGIIDRIDNRKSELYILKHDLEKKLADKKILLSQKTELEEKKESITDNIQNYEKLQKIDKVKAKIQRANQLKDFLSKIEDLRSERDYVDFKDSSNDENLKVENLNSEIEKLSNSDFSSDNKNSILELEKFKSKESFYFKLKLLSSIIFLIGVLLLFYSLWLGISGILLGMGSLLYSSIYSKKNEKLIKNEKDKLDKISENENILKTQIDSLSNALWEIFKARNVSSVREYRERYTSYINIITKVEAFGSAYTNFLNGENINDIIAESVNLTKIYGTFLDKNTNDVDAKISEGRNILKDIESKLIDIKYKLNNEYNNSTCVTDILSELDSLETKKDEYERRYKALDLAIETLEKSFSAIQSNFGPKLNENVGIIINKLTNGKYNHVRVSDKYFLKLMCGSDGLKDAEYLSQGTYEQVYLSLRLGISKLICPENRILFLDDTFSMYDDVRSLRAIETAKLLSEECQVIIFTCQNRDIENAEKLDCENILKI